MDIDFFEQPTGDIRVYLESQFEISGFVHSVYGGISEFFTFIDGHFTRRLREHTAILTARNRPVDTNKAMSLYKYLVPERFDVLQNGIIIFSQHMALNYPFEMKPYFDWLASDLFSYAIF